MTKLSEKQKLILDVLVQGGSLNYEDYDDHPEWILWDNNDRLVSIIHSRTASSLIERGLIEYKRENHRVEFYGLPEAK